MADGSNPPPPHEALTDAGFRIMTLALAPVAAIDSDAGLRARYRDPREHPGTGGEQRDAAGALDHASDAGRLTAHRVAYARYQQLSPDARRTALWLAQRGGAVRDGAIVEVEAWAVIYGRLDGPLLLREPAERSAFLASAADTKLRGLKHRARAGLTEALAKEIDEARAAEEQARAAMRAAQEGLFGWAMGRFEALWVEWRALR